MNKKYYTYLGRIMCFSFTSVFILFYFLYTGQNKNNSALAIEYNTEPQDSFVLLENELSLENNLISSLPSYSAENYFTGRNEDSKDVGIFFDMTKTELIKYKEELENKTEEEKQQSCFDINQEIQNIEHALENGEYLYPYTYYDLQLLSYGIYREAGSWWLEDRHRDLVGLVYLNRKNQNGINKDLINPTFEDIMNEDGQYPYKSWHLNTNEIPEYCFESAIRVLEHKVTCPTNVIWQATFKQGKGVYDKFKDSYTGIVTYFCYD